MLPIWRGFCGIGRQVTGSKILDSRFTNIQHLNSGTQLFNCLPTCERRTGADVPQQPTCSLSHSIPPFSLKSQNYAAAETNIHTHRGLGTCKNDSCHPNILDANVHFRCMSTVGHLEDSDKDNGAAPTDTVLPQHIKVKRLDKTAKHIMNILDKEAVDKVRSEREIPDIQPGYIIELKVEAPENKGRISTVKGLVIGRRNSGLSTNIRVRRLEANVGVESVFPLYSPNIKGIKVLEKRSVRRAKLYYIRDRPFNIALRELAQRTAKKRDMALRGKRMEQSKNKQG